MTHARTPPLLLAALALLGCHGEGPGPADDPRGDTPGDTPADTVATPDCADAVPPLPDASAVAPALVRRLTVHELDTLLRVLLGDRTAPAASVFPDDTRTPYDNDVATQQPSRDWIAAAETFATEAAARLVADPTAFREATGCALDDADVAGCVDRAIRKLAPIALRRPMTDAEIAEFITLAAPSDDLGAAISRFLRVLLQDGEVLYRVEIGLPASAELRLLTPAEVASRLSFLVIDAPPGAEPPDADPCRYYDPAFRRQQIATLLQRAEAREAATRLHAMWIGYERQIGSTNAPMLQQQADNLVTHVLFDQSAPWEELLTTRGAWLHEGLAELYGLQGLAPPREGAWFDDADPTRAGILSWGAFLAVGPRATDTSPTQRGKIIQERLLCQPVPPPPPAVKVDGPPPQTAGTCKADRYEAHRADPACAGCHALLDDVGFGLEMYDVDGVLRAFEPTYTPTGTRPDERCPVPTEGTLPTLGAFSGPVELAELLVEAGAVQACFVENALRWTRGRAAVDHAEVDAISAAWLDAGGRYADLLAEIAAADTFVYRREE